MFFAMVNRIESCVLIMETVANNMKRIIVYLINVSQFDSQYAVSNVSSNLHVNRKLNEPPLGNLGRFFFVLIILVMLNMSYMGTPLHFRDFVFFGRVIQSNPFCK